MAYGFAKPKTAPCPVSGAKHKWTFLRNARQTTGTFGPAGSSVRMTLKGLYLCQCSATRLGQPNFNAPEADLRTAGEASR